ncbi:MAG: hypothetical protein P8Q52_09135 [Acidimicrobiales bacterium]|nr:hypothetical protein [Acidimicrobiales bacterium]
MVLERVGQARLIEVERGIERSQSHAESPRYADPVEPLYRLAFIDSVAGIGPFVLRS